MRKLFDVPVLLAVIVLLMIAMFVSVVHIEQQIDQSSSYASWAVGVGGLVVCLILLVVFSRFRQQSRDICDYDKAAKKLNKEVKHYREKVDG